MDYFESEGGSWTFDFTQQPVEMVKESNAQKRFGISSHRHIVFLEQTRLHRPRQHEFVLWTVLRFISLVPDWRMHILFGGAEGGGGGMNP